MAEILRQPSVLRAMTRADLDLVLPIQRDAAQVAFATVFPQDEFPFPTEAIRHRWEHELSDPDIACFVIVGAARSVGGFATVRGHQLLHFGTALSAWGSGLAGAAHAEVLDHWKAHGYERGWLRVLDQNHRARRFYERRGWHATSERERSTFAPFPVLVRYEVDLLAV